ncbi:Tat pathway signal sequence domain protein [Photobacterium kishitanii]|uniref:DUF6250 domain-containing protein n=1 Tax=Photobacterium kishitanii TaxID=318456 RepID=UPI000D16F3AA|nr:DUF6250 domain-containing protein [Photobacterium kishitanii]PSW60558.1 Tat pathway signal sequence domain protein [Photobacterium kishitanii]
MKVKLFALVCATVFSYSVLATENKSLDPVKLINQQGTLIYSDSFDNQLSQWVIEKIDTSVVDIKQGEMDINDDGGTTVWFKHSIAAPSVIEFEGKVVVAGGKNDRGTDLNFFWMAQEPGSTDFFAKSKWRGGDMRKYDPMQLYYIGYGANDNSTTRFRRYPGDGTRPLLPQYDVIDQVFMNVPNTHTKIQIVSLNEGTYVYANGKKLYFIDGEKEFNKGYFGFRTWKSHVAIDNFKVYSLAML